MLTVARVLQILGWAEKLYNIPSLIMAARQRFPELNTDEVEDKGKALDEERAAALRRVEVHNTDPAPPPTVGDEETDQ